jgi:hypothetical protein
MESHPDGLCNGIGSYEPVEKSEREDTRLAYEFPSIKLKSKLELLSPTK